MGLSPFHAQRLFTRWAGLSPSASGAAHRRACEVPPAHDRERAGRRARGRSFGRVTPARSVLELRGHQPGEYKTQGARARLRWACAWNARSARRSWLPAIEAFPVLDSWSAAGWSGRLAEAKADWPLSPAGGMPRAARLTSRPRSWRAPGCAGARACSPGHAVPVQVAGAMRIPRAAVSYGGSPRPASGGRALPGPWARLWAPTGRRADPVPSGTCGSPCLGGYRLGSWSANRRCWPGKARVGWRLPIAARRPGRPW